MEDRAQRRDAGAGARSRPAPYATAYKKRTYSPNRVKYPLKRVDWDPNGERNPQNRGKSKYVRISWDEATDIIAREIARIHKQYGPNAILVQGDGHGESKTIHTPHGHSARLLTRWAASPCRSASRTAGRAGTGAPSTCGATASRA